MGNRSGFGVAMLSIAALATLESNAQSKEFRQDVEFQHGGSLTLNAGRGSVNLSSWGETQIRINALIESPKGVDPDYARKIVEAARVGLEGGPRSLTIRSVYDDVPFREEGGGSGTRILPHIHYRIQAPSKLNLHVNASRTRIDISGFEGRISVQDRRGDYQIRNLHGHIRLQVSRGKLIANDLNGSVNITGKRSSISAKGISGPVNLDVSRGKAGLSGIRGSLNAKSNRAKLKVSEIQIDGDSRVENYRGTIQITIPDSLGLSIRTDVGRRGQLNSDFEITMSEITGRDFVGSLNGGGHELFLKTDRGTIFLKR